MQLGSISVYTQNWAVNWWSAIAAGSLLCIFYMSVIKNVKHIFMFHNFKIETKIKMKIFLKYQVLCT